MRRWLCIIALLTAAPGAYAFEAPLTYARAPVEVVLHNPVNAKSGNTLSFDTAIRSAESVVANPGWYSFTGPDENKASMLLYATPTTAQVQPSNVYAPTDILFVDSFGVIQEILPSLIPANLEETITSKQPVLAVLYLKSGTCARTGLSPGDQVEYGSFRKRPIILDTVPSPAAAAPAQRVPVPLLNTVPAPAASSSLSSSSSGGINRERLIDHIFQQNGGR